jgi:hypothetical protein
MLAGRWRTAALAALLIGGAGPARAGETTCHGTARGAVEGSFGCAVEARSLGEAVGVTFSALAQVGDAQSFGLGGFQLAPPLRAGQYDLADMLAARSSVISSSGALYAATRTSRDHGEVRLVLRTVRPLASGAYEVHGTLHAVLAPSGTARQDSITIDVEF